MPSAGGSSGGGGRSGGSGNYTVKPGETLSEIAERYGTSVQRLMQLNGLRSASDLWAGSRIQVPSAGGSSGGGSAPRTAVNRNASQHKVRPGETLSTIADLYGVPMQRLVALNGLSRPDLVEAGTTLKLRSSAPAAPKPKPAAKPASKPAPRPVVQQASKPPAKPTSQPATRPAAQPTATAAVTPAATATVTPTVTAAKPASTTPTTTPTTTPISTASTTPQPSSQAPVRPTAQNTPQNTVQASAQPTVQPNVKPTAQPTTLQAAVQPSGNPASTPAARPAASATTRPVVSSQAVPSKPVASTKPSSSTSKPSTPDWRSYGPLQVDWANWQSMGGSYVAPSLNSDGQPLYLAINCNAKRLNATGQSGSWKTWDAPQSEFEQQLITDLCKAKQS